MADLIITAERVLAAPAPVVHRCIADYTRHHRTDGFLPPAFTFLDVLEGGVGAATRIRFGVRLGWMRSTSEATISEPDPGRVLVEDGPDVTTRFIVDPADRGARVRIESAFHLHGLMGSLAGRSLPAKLRPVYEDELTRLEAYAAALAAREGGAAA